MHLTTRQATSLHHRHCRHQAVNHALPPLPALTQLLPLLPMSAGIVKSNPVSNFWQWLGRSNALLVFAVNIPEVRPAA
jgi:hypothetical protein